MKTKLLLILVAVTVSFCSTEETDPIQTNPNSVIILNEGVFNSITAGISIYDSETKEITNDAYITANPDAQLGDVAHSMTLIDNEYFLVVNNSRKIEVLNPKNLERKRILLLPEGSSPRYVAEGSGYEIIVTDLFSSSLKRINKTTGELISTINIGTTSEMILKVGSKLFVANPGPFGSADSSVTVIDLSDYSFRKIDTGALNLYNLTVDSNHNVWAVASGTYDSQTFTSNNDGAVIVIDSDSEQIINTIEVGGNPGDIGFDSSKGRVYVANGSKIQQIDGQTFQIIPNALINTAVYSLAVDGINAKIYIGDPLNYSQQGLLKVYSTDGDSLGQVTVGVIPGFISLHN